MHLYQPDNLIPATPLILDAGLLREHLGPRLPAGTELKIQSIRYKPRTSCLVSYLLTGASESKPIHLHAKAYTRDDWRKRKGKLLAKHPVVIADDEIAFALFKFPIDEQLDGLDSCLSNPNELISSILFDSFQGEEVRGVETLAYKPNRRYTAKVSFESGLHAVLKLHDQTSFGRAKEATKLLKKSRIHGTPDRIGRSNRYRAFLNQWVLGDSIDLSAGTAGEIESLIEGIFTYLDWLHIPVATAQPARQYGQRISSMASYLGEIYTPVKSRAASVANRLNANKPNPTQSCVVHGDFHEQQVLMSSGKVTACDLDNCHVGESTLDIASFVGHLCYRACLGELPVARFDEINDLVIQRMAAAGLLESYCWNLYSSIFRLASHPFRSGSSRWVDQTQWLISRVEDHLELPQRSNGLSQKSASVMPVAGPRPDLKNSILRDPKFSFLHEVFDESIAQQKITEHVGEFKQRFGDFQVIAVRGWRHKQGRRCMLQFQLETAAGPKLVLGKVSAKRFDRRSLSIQTKLAEHNDLDDVCRAASVPATIGGMPMWNMWFQLQVDGLTGDELLSNGSLGSATNQIADAMTWLHHRKIKIKRQHTVDDELSILRDRLAEAAQMLPTYSARIQAVFESCEEILRTVNSQTVVTAHRDFYQDQFLFDGSQVTLIDLDLVSLSQPALDVGNFLAHLTEHAIRVHRASDRWAREEQAISSRYIMKNPATSIDEILAFKIVSLARHIAISMKHADRRDTTDPIVTEVEKLILQFRCNAETHLRR